MATIILRSWHANRSESGAVQVTVLTAKADPFPKRMVDVKSTADALAALEAYKVEAVAAGAPLAVSMSLKSGERAPRGFNDAAARPPYHPVNV